jgi:hypothetical protein
VAARSIRDELLSNLDKLSPEKQRELLAYACSLVESTPPSPGTLGKELAIFAGAIEANDLGKIAQAIEEDCERVELGAW